MLSNYFQPMEKGRFYYFLDHLDWQLESQSLKKMYNNLGGSKGKCFAENVMNHMKEVQYGMTGEVFTLKRSRRLSQKQLLRPTLLLILKTKTKPTNKKNLFFFFFGRKVFYKKKSKNSFEEEHSMHRKAIQG